MSAFTSVVCLSRHDKVKNSESTADRQPLSSPFINGMYIGAATLCTACTQSACGAQLDQPLAWAHLTPPTGSMSCVLCHCSDLMEMLLLLLLFFVYLFIFLFSYLFPDGRSYNPDLTDLCQPTPHDHIKVTQVSLCV